MKMMIWKIKSKIFIIRMDTTKILIMRINNKIIMGQTKKPLLLKDKQQMLVIIINKALLRVILSNKIIMTIIIKMEWKWLSMEIHLHIKIIIEIIKFQISITMKKIMNKKILAIRYKEQQRGLSDSNCHLKVGNSSMIMKCNFQMKKV